MYVSKSFMFKVIAVCLMLYLISVILMLSKINSLKCLTLQSSHLSSNDSSNLITFVIIEFEMFENDLTDTITNLCKIALTHRILIISETHIYPKLSLPHQSINDCDLQIIVTSTDVRKSMKQTDPHSYIDTDFVFIVPDSVRIMSTNTIYDLLSEFDNQMRAIIVPINRYQQHKHKCIRIDIDIKRWTLSYIHNNQNNVCEAFDENNAVLIRKNALFELNQPFMRPFVHSFSIQSKVRDIQLKLSNKALYSGKQLFAANTRSEWKSAMLLKDRLKSLYISFAIKKVIDINGDIEWYGCTKSTKRCFPTVIDDTPDYLFTDRWTPPCCLKNLEITAKHVFETLENSGVRYWLEGGSLLGAARNGHIIPWDYDVDIGIYVHDIVKCPHFTYINKTPIIDEKGFLWEKAIEGDFFRVHFSATNRIHVDIFPFYSINGTMTKNTWFKSHPQDREFPEHYLKPLTKIRFLNRDVFAPNNIKQFLEFKFGKNVINNPQYPNPFLINLNKIDNNRSDYT